MLLFDRSRIDCCHHALVVRAAGCKRNIGSTNVWRKNPPQYAKGAKVPKKLRVLRAFAVQITLKSGEPEHPFSKRSQFLEGAKLVGKFSTNVYSRRGEIPVC